MFASSFEKAGLEMNRLLWSFLALVLCGSVAARAAANGEEPRWITVDAPLTEIVFALGLGDRVIAVDTSSTRPDVVTDLPQVGYVRAMNAEGLLALRPDRILATTSIGPPLVVEQIRRSGVAMTILDRPEDSESLYAAIRQVADLGGVEERAEAMVADLERDFAELGRIVPADRSEIRAVFILAHFGDGRGAGGDTLAAKLLEIVGVENVLKDRNGYVGLSTEALLGLRPDVLLIGTQGLTPDHRRGDLLRMGGVEELAGIGTLRVIPVDLTETLVFGPRFGKSAVQLARTLHKPGAESGGAGETTIRR